MTDLALMDAMVTLVGKLESMHSTLGESDVFVVCEYPDRLGAAEEAAPAQVRGSLRRRVR